MLTFYTHPQSRGRIVRWMLEETGLDYDTVPLAWADMQADDFQTVNPIGKVPTIVHDGRLVTEGAAICAYLADVHPKAALAPPLPDRADYYRWLFFMAGPGEAGTVDRLLGVAPTPEQERLVGYGSFERMIDTLERATTTHAYVAGPRFTAADVYLGGLLVMGLGYGSLPERPGFRAYCDRLVSRPAFQRATALDDALAASVG